MHRLTASELVGAEKSKRKMSTRKEILFRPRSAIERVIANAFFDVSACDRCLLRARFNHSNGERDAMPLPDDYVVRSMHEKYISLRFQLHIVKIDRNRSSGGWSASRFAYCIYFWNVCRFRLELHSPIFDPAAPLKGALRSLSRAKRSRNDHMRKRTVMISFGVHECTQNEARQTAHRRNHVHWVAFCRCAVAVALLASVNSILLYRLPEHCGI